MRWYWMAISSARRSSRECLKYALALGAALAALVLCTPAHADDAWQLVPIQINAPDGVAVTLSQPSSQQATAHCLGNCALRLIPGDYRLYAEDTRSQRTLTRSLLLTGAGTIDVKLGDPSTRSSGVALAVVGGAAAAVGLAVFFDGMEHVVLCESNCGHGNSEMTAGLLVGLAGAIVFPIGLVLAYSERDRVLFDEQPQREHSETARLQLGVARMPEGGLGVAGSLLF